MNIFSWSKCVHLFLIFVNWVCKTGELFLNSGVKYPSTHSIHMLTCWAECFPNLSDQFDFFYCQLHQLATARGLLLMQKGDSETHHPVASRGGPCCLTKLLPNLIWGKAKAYFLVRKAFSAVPCYSFKMKTPSSFFFFQFYWSIQLHPVLIELSPLQHPC